MDLLHYQCNSVSGITRNGGQSFSLQDIIVHLYLLVPGFQRACLAATD